MQHNSGVFVKLNYKTIGEFKSLIIDREGISNEYEKYMMCAGKYDKDGWTFVFKANSLKEAEALINNNSLRTRKKSNYRKSIIDNNVNVIDNEIVQIPAWM